MAETMETAASPDHANERANGLGRPENDGRLLAPRQLALREFLARVEKEPMIVVGPWTREELHERGS